MTTMMMIIIITACQACNALSTALAIANLSVCRSQAGILSKKRSGRVCDKATRQKIMSTNQTRRMTL